MWHIPRSMSNVTYLSRPLADPIMKGSFVDLACDVRSYFDPGPIKKLYGRMTPHEADDLICRFLEDMARRLDQLQRGLAAHDAMMMARPARRIALMAQLMGLIEVATSARHVRVCLSQTDGIALEATVARLERGFDMAVNEVWNLREL